jgi:hypothetical protein
MELDLSGNALDNRAFWRSWIPFLWIIVAGALAHLWCLGSQFYMDDMGAISENDLIRSGEWWKSGLLNAWTTFGYVVQYKLFGISPVAFHAVNWLLHTAVACVLFGFGREFLRDRLPSGVAWFGALLFVVHPLASEIPNYARTQDLAWVTLFSLSACWALLNFLRGGGVRWLLWMVLGIIGAALSKGPGMFHVLMMTGAVGLGFMTTAHWNMLRLRMWWVIAVVLSGIAVMWLAGVLDGFWQATGHWKEPRFIGHAYTLARVFWEFAWRAVLPVSLCSDHQIAETLVPPGSGWLSVPDKGAMWTAFTMLALTGFSVWLSMRKITRPLGICLFLFVATMLFRVLYLIPEFMPEYRIYPGMPWFCLGAAILFASAWKVLAGDASPRIPVVFLLIIFASMSANRSFEWHDLNRLTTNILRQYPAQARALWELQERDATAGQWQKVIDRQQKEWNPILERFLKENRRLAPKRELPSGHFALADVACKGRYALAIAHVMGPAAGLSEIRKIEIYMRQLRIDQPIHWGYFNTAKALVLEQGGSYQAALDLIRTSETPHNLKEDDIRRIEKKLAENPASSR